MAEVGEISIQDIAGQPESTSAGVEIRAQTITEIPRIIQEKTGMNSVVSEVLIKRGGISDGTAGASVVEGTSGNKEGVILIPDKFTDERKGIEVTAHELGHVVVGSHLESIADEKIKYAVREGVLDLIAIEVSDEISGERKAPHIVDERAAQYENLKGRESEVDRYFAEPIAVTPLEVDTSGVASEDIGHIIGRRFAYSLRNTRPDLDIKGILGCVLANPPSREELLTPALYLPKLDGYEHTTREKTPIQVVVTDKQRRII